MAICVLSGVIDCIIKVFIMSNIGRMSAVSECFKTVLLGISSSPEENNFGGRSLKICFSPILVPVLKFINLDMLDLV